MQCFPRRDLARLRDDLMACFRETRPSPRFHSALFLGLTWLHLAARNLEKTRDLNERRYWINEFTKGQKTIYQAIDLLRQKSETRQVDETAGRALP